MDQVGFADGPGAGANQEQAGLIPGLYNFSHVHFDLLLRCFVVLPWLVVQFRFCFAGQKV